MSTSENKQRVVAWLPPQQIRVMNSLLELHNMKNPSEFVDKAVAFYIGYLNSTNTTEYLADILMNALKATVETGERRQANNIFRLTVEMSLMMNILAAGLDISDETIKKMRGRCVQEIKATKGRVAFEDALAYQNSPD